MRTFGTEMPGVSMLSTVSVSGSSSRRWSDPVDHEADPRGVQPAATVRWTAWGGYARRHRSVRVSRRLERSRVIGARRAERTALIVIGMINAYEHADADLFD